MSRKDRRKSMRIPVTAPSLAVLRAQAQGRSLGDAARRLVEHSLGWDVPASPMGGEVVRHLGVQLPRSVLRRVRAQARERGLTPEELVARLIAQHSMPNL